VPCPVSEKETSRPPALCVGVITGVMVAPEVVTVGEGLALIE
jgi:hypothetical protein